MNKALFAFRVALAACALLALGACSKGIDKSLVTDKGPEAYRASLSVAAKDFSDREREAFDWAVSDLSLDALNARYPNKSAREVIRGEVKAVLKGYPPQIAELDKQVITWKSTAEEIQKVTADHVEFALERDFHGLQPRIQAVATNNSKFGYSSLYWRAGLFLNGAAEPVATAELIDLYKDESGLKPGEAKPRRFHVGFVTGDAAWTTLEVQNAQQRVVKLIVMPERAEDFGEKLIAGDSPEKKVRSAQSILAAAEKFKDL